MVTKIRCNPTAPRIFLGRYHIKFSFMIKINLVNIEQVDYSLCLITLKMFLLEILSKHLKPIKLCLFFCQSVGLMPAILGYRTDLIETVHIIICYRSYLIRGQVILAHTPSGTIPQKLEICNRNIETLYDLIHTSVLGLLRKCTILSHYYGIRFAQT